MMDTPLPELEQLPLEQVPQEQLTDPYTVQDTQAPLPPLPTQLQADLDLAQQLRDQFEGIEDTQIIKELSAYRIREQAEELGIHPDAAQALHDGDMTAFARSLMEQEQALGQQYPDFDLHQALSDHFVRMLVAAGAPLERVAGYVCMDARIQQAKQQARHEVIEGIRARSNRPPTEMPGTEQPASGLSDAQVRHIDARLKRGERVEI